MDVNSGCCLAGAALLALLLSSCRRPASEGTHATPTSTVATMATSSSRAATSGSAGGPAFLQEMLGQSSAMPFELSRVKEETRQFSQGSAAIAGAPDFLFVLGQGSGWHGYDTLRVDATGKAELIHAGPKDGEWRRAAFQLSAEELAGLRAELTRIDVFGLKRAYLAAVDDGTQWFVRVRAASQRKTVMLDNHFPEPIAQLAEHVRTKVVAPHRAEIDRGEVPLLPGQRSEPPEWPEDATPGR